MATKKQTPKKTVIKADKKETKTEASPKSFKLDFSSKFLKIHLIPLAILLLIIGFLVKTQLYVASVNGENISRLKLISLLEKQGGQQVLDGLITETLIQQEADSQSITISQEEIDAEIAKIETQFSSGETSFDEILAMQGMTRDDLVDQLKLQLLAQKMVAEKIEVSDEELNTYLEDNKEMFPEDTDTEDALFRNEIKESLKSQKINEEINNLITSLKSQAQITYNIEY